MSEGSEAFVGLDTSKTKISVAVADGGRCGEVRFYGDIDSSPDAVNRLVKKLSAKYRRLHLCYEAGPCGYGLHRQLTALGHQCDVVAPSMIPIRPGDRIKTNRRDAITLARLHRAGELTPVWVPDEAHEAVRDLVRAREAAMLDLRHHGIRVAAICPGSVETDFAAGRMRGGDWKLQPEDVARCVVDLLDFPARALPSLIELRPSRPPKPSAGG